MSQQEELISVIVPVYNAEMYFSACLDSILTQSHRNLEIIVVNDGSSDFSLKIAESYAQKDDRIKVYNQENKGVSEARNVGISVATGEYFSFVDSDDILLPKSLELMMSVIKKYEVDIVEGKIIYGEDPHRLKYKETVTTKIYTPEKAIENVLYQHKMLPSVWGKLFKANLFEDIRFKKGIIYEDLDILYKIYEKSSHIAYTDFPVYFYRHNEQSLIHSWRPDRLNVLAVTEDIENYIAEKYPHLLDAARDRRLSANFNMFALCSIHGDNENAEKCWEHIKKNRLKSLLQPRVRLKNKAGVLLSYFGKKIFRFSSRIVYK